MVPAQYGVLSRGAKTVRPCCQASRASAASVLVVVRVPHPIPRSLASGRRNVIDTTSSAAEPSVRLPTQREGTGDARASDRDCDVACPRRGNGGVRRRPRCRPGRVGRTAAAAAPAARPGAGDHAGQSLGCSARSRAGPTPAVFRPAAPRPGQLCPARAARARPRDRRPRRAARARLRDRRAPRPRAEPVRLSRRTFKINRRQPVVVRRFIGVDHGSGCVDVEHFLHSAPDRSAGLGARGSAFGHVLVDLRRRPGAGAVPAAAGPDHRARRRTGLDRGPDPDRAAGRAVAPPRPRRLPDSTGPADPSRLGPSRAGPRRARRGALRVGCGALPRTRIRAATE